MVSAGHVRATFGRLMTNWATYYKSGRTEGKKVAVAKRTNSNTSLLSHTHTHTNTYIDIYMYLCIRCLEKVAASSGLHVTWRAVKCQQYLSCQLTLHIFTTRPQYEVVKLKFFASCCCCRCCCWQSRQRFPIALLVFNKDWQLAPGGLGSQCSFFGVRRIYSRSEVRNRLGDDAGRCFMCLQRGAERLDSTRI